MSASAASVECRVSSMEPMTAPDLVADSTTPVFGSEEQ